MTALNTSSTDSWYRAGSPKTGQTDDARIKEITVLPPPEHLIRFFPIRGTAVETLISDTRRSIHNIMRAQDDRLLVIVGPCSIHDPAAALDYARRLAVVREQYKDTLEVVMRVYFEKPRTTVGWKGLINDPYLDQSYRIDEGLRIARQLLIDINRLGVPAASEFLDVISPQYIGDLIAWVPSVPAPRKARCTVNWPRASRRRSASRTALTAISALPPMRFSRPAAVTTSCRCTRTARSPSCTREATRTAT